eukprot:1844184-Amphidinium_carterae.1
MEKNNKNGNRPFLKKIPLVAVPSFLPEFPSQLYVITPVLTESDSCCLFQQESFTYARKGYRVQPSGVARSAQCMTMALVIDLATVQTKYITLQFQFSSKWLS